MEKLRDYLRISAAAEYLGVSTNTLRNWERAGKIAAHRHPVNRYRLFIQDELDALLRQVRRERQRSHDRKNLRGTSAISGRHHRRLPEGGRKQSHCQLAPEAIVGALSPQFAGLLPESVNSQKVGTLSPLRFRQMSMLSRLMWQRWSRVSTNSQGTCGRLIGVGSWQGCPSHANQEHSIGVH